MSKETSQNSKKHNFFNLDSASDEDSNETEKKRQDEINKKIQKWDWDRPENLDLYFKQSYEAKKPSKRSLLLDEVDNETQTSTKKVHESAKRTSRVKPYIESHECGPSLGSSNKLVFELVGHKSSVNRIHWCRKPENKNIILSSSMDG